MIKRCSFLFVLSFISFTISAQDEKKEPEKPKWDVAKPGESFNYKSHNFITSEGILKC